jgi:ferric-dicitrate binding protein FerR (iron transport regulator)
VHDELPRRPFDHQVEPLFAGLGLEQPAPRRSRRRALAWLALLAIGVAALVWLWLG